jgi:hypothetical protein
MKRFSTTLAVSLAISMVVVCSPRPSRATRS